jgi:transposase
MIKQEGYKMPSKFFQTKNWQDKLSRMRIGTTQKVILSSYMNSVEGLQAAETELTEKILEIKGKDIALLESIPGLGKLSSRVLVGALDNVERFDNKKSAAKYGALTPRIYQSGGLTHLGRINRDGRMEVRRVLLQCAHTIGRMKSYESAPLREFFNRIEKRRGKKIAVVAMARKLLTIAYGVLKSGRVYNPAILQNT